MTITITHTHVDGTLLDGSSKGDGVYEIVRKHGFTYRRSVGIFIMGSRDRVANRWKINRAAKALREAGFEVTVEIDDQHRDRADVLAGQAVRLDDRREALEAKAARQGAEAEARYDAADQISKRFEGGQPILKGHYSERRARKDQERIDTNMRKATEAYRDSQETTRRADAVGTNLDYAAKFRPTQRRIKTTEAKLRDIQRKLDGQLLGHRKSDGQPVYVSGHAPASGEWRESLEARKAQMENQLEYDRKLVADFEAAGHIVWGKHNIHKGDLVKVWYGWKEVVKVNPTTAGCKTEYTWLDKVKYTDIVEVRCPHNQPEPEPVDLEAELAALDAADEARFAATEAEREEKAAHKRASSFAGKWIADVVREGRPYEPTDDNLEAAFANTVKPPHRDLYDRIRAEIVRQVAEIPPADLLPAETVAWDAYEQTPAETRRIDLGDKLAAWKAGDGPKAAPAPDPADGFFRTPTAVAAKLVAEDTFIAHLDAPLVLEPSAGTGALVKAICEANPNARVWAVEPNTNRLSMIPRFDGRVQGRLIGFEDFAAGDERPPLFDAVVMNPPFALAGQPTVWIDHVRLAWDQVAPGGRLTAIVPAGFSYRTDKRHTAMRELVDEFGGWYDLPAGSFNVSGTGVSTCVLWLDKPQAAESGTLFDLSA